MSRKKIRAKLAMVGLFIDELIFLFNFQLQVSPLRYASVEMTILW